MLQDFHRLLANLTVLIWETRKGGDLKDFTGRLQISFRKDVLGDKYDFFKKFIDVGDVIYVRVVFIIRAVRAYFGCRRLQASEQMPEAFTRKMAWCKGPRSALSSEVFGPYHRR